jgi:hypothetical protein
VLLPLFALGALWLIRRGGAPRKIWALPVVVAAALSLSAWVAIQTGEREEDRVERVVGDSPMHSHEEAAERFLLLSFAMLALAAGGLAPGKVGSVVRVVATGAAVVLVGAGVQVGNTGGELVYQHGAASAYTRGRQVTEIGAVDGNRERRERDDDR